MYKLQLMSCSEINELRNTVLQNYELAKDNVKKRLIAESSRPISNKVLPAINYNNLEFGSYIDDKYVVLFVDMRDSTNRARRLGAKGTFLTMHAFIPTMVGVIDYHKGNIVDIMGDGIMAVWKFDDYKSIIDGISCGIDLLKCKEEITNTILPNDHIAPVDCGIGIDYGNVIITKVGIYKNHTYDIKAFGDCINTASKLSGNSNVNKIFISKSVDDCLQNRFNYDDLMFNYSVFDIEKKDIYEG